MFIESQLPPAKNKTQLPPAEDKTRMKKEETSTSQKAAITFREYLDQQKK